MGSRRREIKTRRAQERRARAYQRDREIAQDKKYTEWYNSQGLPAENQVYNSLRDRQGIEDLDYRGRADFLRDKRGEIDRESWLNKSWDWLTRNDDYRWREWFENNPDAIQRLESKIREEQKQEDIEFKEEERTDEIRDLFFDEIERRMDQEEEIQDNIDDYEKEAKRISDQEQAELQASYDDYKKKLGFADDILDRSVDQAQEYARSGSVADQTLRDTIFGDQVSTAQAYSGRTGAGYLQDFQRARDLNSQKLADQGARLRLSEEQEKQKFLQNVLSSASQQKASFANQPLDLIAMIQNARRFPLSQRQLADQRRQALFTNQNNFLDKLYAWKMGQQNFASAEQNKGFTQDIQGRVQARGDRAGRRADNSLAFEKDRFNSKFLYDGIKDAAGGYGWLKDQRAKAAKKAAEGS